MTDEQPITELQKRSDAARGRNTFLFALSSLAVVLGTIALLIGIYGASMLMMTYGRSLPGNEPHFKYGSIGAELANGLPYRIFTALPKVFPEKFGLTEAEAGALKRDEIGKAFRHFGMLYDANDAAINNGLPIGFATGVRMGQEVVWFNCAICHSGQVARPDEKKPDIHLGMPANTLNLERFFLALFDMAVDKRFSWSSKAFREALGVDELWWYERLIWQWAIVPYTRSVLLRRRSELLPLLDPKRAWGDVPVPAKLCKAFPETSTYRQNCGTLARKEPPPYPRKRPLVKPTRWGPGRVDTFNPYKLIHFNMSADCLTPEERVGFTDFPTIYLQGERAHQMMHLHWDGNNASLKERNLSAALGAGVSPETVRHGAIERVAGWLSSLEPPRNPYYTPDQLEQNKAAIDRGFDIYMKNCADCHGYYDVASKSYRFTGSRLGKIEPIQHIQTDPGRLDSYTATMEMFQKNQLFCQTPRHRFSHFKKTNGYANMPLDGLWLRAPYLHNGSVPTLRDLLKKPAERPKMFVRGEYVLDAKNGGFIAPACTGPLPSEGIDLTRHCYDTTKEGNSNAGHDYGASLSDAEKEDLLRYLMTF